MSQFNTNKWFKNQYLKEANLYEEKADLAAKAIDQAIAGVDESLGYSDFAKAVATILKDEYGAHNFNPFMEVLHAELGMEESLNEAEEMATYKVTVTLAEPGEGGPDYDEDVEVKVDASLSGDELRDAVRDAIGKEGYNRKNIYKFKYEKA
jgi:hypothetical protein